MQEAAMKQILMIGTGGTIASGKTAEGLMPELTSEQLLAFVPAVSALCRVVSAAAVARQHESRPGPLAADRGGYPRTL